VTFIYAGLFLCSGTVLIAISYVLVRQADGQSGIALAITAALSIALGRLGAGRLLRPLRTLEAQRRFVSNASHELRTPLAVTRTLAEVALADSDATVDSLRAAHEQVLASCEQQERLIEALLTLGRSGRGLDQREPFDLSVVTQGVLAAHRAEADSQRISVHAVLEPAEVSGAPRLAERLVANLIDNALRHNLPAGGWIDVTATTRDRRAVLTVANSGPPVPPEKVERLFQPFERLSAERDGVGLGLSIVRAIAAAHQATVTANAQRGGGLEIEVNFPPMCVRANEVGANGRLRAQLFRRRPYRAPAAAEKP
jgi:signal transduction histidine kinase